MGKKFKKLKFGFVNLALDFLQKEMEATVVEFL